MSQYKLIIFDFDGTLTKTDKAIISAMHKTFKKFKLAPPDPAIIKSMIGIPLEAALQALYPPLIPAELHQWVESYREFYQLEGNTQTELFSGVEEILNLAIAAEIKLTVLSNKYDQAVNSALESLQIHQFFDVVVGVNSKVKSKPAPDAFLTLIKPKFPDIINEQILMVGDTAIDLLFAENAGIDACWAAYGYGKLDEYPDIQPKFTIQQISDLAAIIQ